MRLILFVLKCAVGLLASLGFVIVLGAVGLGLAWRHLDAFKPQEEALPDRMVLVLDLGESILEAQPDNRLSEIALGYPLDMRQIGEALSRAATDPRVDGLFVLAGRGALGMAQTQELRGYIEGFKAREKDVTAFAESFGEGGNGTLNYYLASAADKIWLQPSGSLDVTGFILEQPYLRDALDRIGVDPQMGQRSEYKGAVNNLTDSALPAPQRENLQRLLDSWFAQFAQDVAAARGLSPDTVERLVDAAPYDAPQGPDLGLIDQLGYYDQAVDEALDGAGPEAELIALADYAYEPTDEEPAESPKGQDLIALVYGIGPVTLGEGSNDPLFGEIAMGSDTVATALSDAIDDDDVVAIVFRVDSPGGSYVASDVIWREVQRARDLGKPLVISMGNLAASGGYFVAAPAHSIVAEPGTITGSIGVAAGKLALKGLWEKLSVNWDAVEVGKNAGLWSANRPFNDAGWAYLEASLDRTYADFTGKVATGRDLTPAAVEELARGQVWTGADALDLGLVDALGGMQTALAMAKEAAGLQADDEVPLLLLPEPADPWQSLLDGLFSAGFDAAAMVRLARNFELLRDAAAPVSGLAERLDAGQIHRTLRAPDLRLKD